MDVVRGCVEPHHRSSTEEDIRSAICMPVRTNMFHTPELLVLIVSSAVLAICLYSFVRYREYEAISYAVAVAGFVVEYCWISFFDPADEDRRVWIRLTIIMLLALIAFWRIVFMWNENRKKREPK